MQNDDRFWQELAWSWQPRCAVMVDGKASGDPAALLAEDAAKWHAEWQAGAATYQDLLAAE